MFRLSENLGSNGTAYRDAICDTIIELMQENERVVMLEADLGGASGTSKIQKKIPQQYVQVGIAEADMMGIAGGMSSEGFIPFTHTFGPFATRRAFDQIYLAGGYAHNTINIWGSDPGFTVGANGGTHTTWEDVALMRTIPGSVVCDAADAVQASWIVREFAKTEGIHYLRTGRKNAPSIYAEGSAFEMGKGNVIREGSDVLIISAGQLVADALKAADALQEQGVSAEVIDMFCIKPLDEGLVRSEAAGKRAVVTFENHNVIGGLGDAVAATLMEGGIAVPFKRHGVCERFGQVGTPEFLQAEFKLTASDLVESVKSLLG
ncbi:transketolase family protein [Olsenella urininfantis]|uniref:transketolase family protein n=1 Tax=Olsenella urininfantis TaxID=1871033 RepID=UPI0009866F35|nr:transketolase C-terminal domain-containing protein [Olsenella urininfantis]